jgi:hypothetical protein
LLELTGWRRHTAECLLNDFKHPGKIWLPGREGSKVVRVDHLSKAMVPVLSAELERNRATTTIHDNIEIDLVEEEFPY